MLRKEGNVYVLDLFARIPPNVTSPVTYTPIEVDATKLRKSGILLKRTVHKEFGAISRERCWWNSPKADVQYSVLRPHCPEVN